MLEGEKGEEDSGLEGPDILTGDQEAPGLGAASSDTSEGSPGSPALP